MPALRTLLPHLGPFLCLALCFSPSLSLNDSEPCILYDKAYFSDDLINITAEVSGENTTYTVTVPVNSSVSAVILKAEKDNNPVGTWSGAYEKCNNSIVYNYNVTSLSNSAFQTNWTVPSSEDVTKVNLTVFIVFVNRTAIWSSVKLESTNPPISTSTPESQNTTMTTANITTTTTTVTTNSSTDVTSDNSTAVTTANSTAVTTANSTAVTTANSTAMTTANSTAVTTAKTTTMTTATTTAKSLAIRTLCSPLAGALHILLVFLISKLLF